MVTSITQQPPPLATAALARVSRALDEIRRGRMVVVSHEGELGHGAELVAAAQRVTAATVNFMAKEARGLIRLCLTEERCDQLRLRPMAPHLDLDAKHEFTVSIEAREGVTTGISAADRAHTIAVAVDSARGAHDLVQPGHVFPVKVAAGGVLERPEITEAAVDLTRLAGLEPAGVACQILDADGDVAGAGDVTAYAGVHGLERISVADVVAYRRHADSRSTGGPA